MVNLPATTFYRNSAARCADEMHNEDITMDELRYMVHGCLDAPMVMSAGSVYGRHQGQAYAVQTIINRE